MKSRRSALAALVLAIAAGCEHRGPAAAEEPEPEPALGPARGPILPLEVSDAAGGCQTGWVDFPGQPVTVIGGSEESVYRRTYEVPLPSGARLVHVASFIGVDSGDIVEADLELEAVRDGTRIYQRSLHKDGSMAYDAWDQRWVAYRCGSGECRIRIVLLGRCTGRNQSAENPNFGELRARIHFGLRLMLCGVPQPLHAD